MSFCRDGRAPRYAGRVKRRIYVTKKLRPHVCNVRSHVCNVGSIHEQNAETRKMSRELVGFFFAKRRPTMVDQGGTMVDQGGTMVD